MKDPKQLHLEFVRLGSMRHKLKNQMLAILPEIYLSGIYKKYTATIVEYAGKFGDISRTTVIKRLRLEENLQDKPLLKAAIQEVGVHKVAMVAKLATAQTDEVFADKVLNMSKLAVQALSKELRAGEEANREEVFGQLTFHELGERGLESGQFQKSMPCKAVGRTVKIELDEQATFLLMKLKNKLKKDLSDKAFLKLILEEKAEREFPEKCLGKAVTREDCVFGDVEMLANGETVKTLESWNRANRGDMDLEKATKNGSVQILRSRKSVTGETSRYIPAQLKREALSQTQEKCSYPNCNFPAQILHHVDRYCESKNHNSITPLCKIHHEFVHNGLVGNEPEEVSQWCLTTSGKPTRKADVLFRKYRRAVQFRA